MSRNIGAIRFVRNVMLVLGLALFQAESAAQYSITDLGTLGGDESRAYGINEIGQVVGEAETVSGQSHAFLWLPRPAYGLPAGMNDLGTLGGSDSAALGINNLGQVVGRADTATPNVSRAFLWDPAAGLLQDLGTLPGPSAADSIDDGGEIVGTARDSIGFDQAFHRSPDGAMVLFSDLMPGDASSGGFGLGYAGNLNFAGTYFFPAQAFKFGGETGILPLEDLGFESFANGMNAVNQVVGSVTTNEWEHAALWEIIALTDLGTLGGNDSRALGLNDVGEVVGFADTAGEIEHAFLWRDGAMTDLNDVLPPGMEWRVESARDVNETGQIVGRGVAPDGHTHAFLMSPLPAPDIRSADGKRAPGSVRRIPPP